MINNNELDIVSKLFLLAINHKPAARNIHMAMLLFSRWAIPLGPIRIYNYLCKNQLLDGDVNKDMSECEITEKGIHLIKRLDVKELTQELKKYLEFREEEVINFFD